jgi:hydroxyacylglutathione hydrolase
MEIKIQPMGATQTNCYIVTKEGKDLIIDPGIGAAEWVKAHTTNPIAILNTHGHYDHVWSNAQLQQELRLPIYCPKGDAFMLNNCPLGQPTPPSKPDYEVNGDEILDLDGLKVKFRHFPGHTPGCSAIEIDDVWFSGDFLFQNSIGRWDFPYSSAEQMLESLKKTLQIQKDYTLYPGHGMSTTLKREQEGMPQWIRYVESTL